jgi:hypothetical protein
MSRPTLLGVGRLEQEYVDHAQFLEGILTMVGMLHELRELFVREVDELDRDEEPDADAGHHGILLPQWGGCENTAPSFGAVKI